MSTTTPVPPLPSSSQGSSSTAAPDASKRPQTPDSGPHRPSTSSSSAPTIRTSAGPAAPALATCLSHSHDAPLAAYISHPAIDDSIYDRLTPSRKYIIVALVSYCSFLSPMGSTTILSAIPEVASEYNTTGTVINISSALYMLFMGISPCFWGPASQIFGRRWVSFVVLLLVSMVRFWVKGDQRVTENNSCLLGPVCQVTVGDVLAYPYPIHSSHNNP